MDTLCLILGIVLLVGALYLCYRPLIPAAIIGYGAMWVLSYGHHITLSKDSLMFWGAATMIILVINSSQAQETDNVKGAGYIASGALVGCIVGMLTTHAGIILGAAIGAILGFMAYSRTPQGLSNKLSVKEFIGQLAAKGLPTIVTLSIIGTAVDNLLTNLATIH